MSASFPGAVRVFTLKHNVTDINFAEDVNALQDEITALQRVLGINPHGNYSDIVSRLNGVDTSLANKAALTHSHTGSTAAAAVPLDGSVQMTGLLLLSSQTPTNINHAARKKYVDDQINANAVDVFAVPGSALVGGAPPTSGLKMMGDSKVVTLTSVGGAAGEANVSYPGTFPTGLITVVAWNGDNNTGDDWIFSSANTTRSNFTVHVKSASGRSMGGLNARVNYISLGW